MKLTKTQIKEALDAFKRVTVKHDLQESTIQLVLFMLELSPNCDIVNLVGPTGIGKSQLQARTIASIQEDASERMRADPDFVPIIRTHALAAGHKLFDWKSLYRGALVELGDPFAITRKAAAGKTNTTPSRFAYTGESRTASELRMCLESEFRARGTKVWIIDEAQHLVFGGRSGQPGDQFDVLKSIAQNTGVKLLLAGPNEMEAGLGSSGQLARRSTTIHYPRYRNDNAKDLTTFANVVGTLFSKMVVGGFPAVKEQIGFFYSGSAGCVGIVKDWLAKSYGLALRDQTKEQKAVVTLDHLREARLSLNTMKRIMNDIRLEEEGLMNAGSDKDFERIVAGPPTAQGGSEMDANVLAEGSKGRKKSVRTGRVGIRSVGPRDRVPACEPETEEA